MSEFNRDIFNRLGIHFESEALADAFAAHLLEDLHVRVGASISEGLSREVLDEFDLIEDKKEAHEWLETNRPDYKTIIFKTQAEVRRELLVHRFRIPGAKLTRALEKDETPVEALGLDGLRNVGIRTAGELVASLDQMPNRIDRMEVAELINRLWEYLIAPSLGSTSIHSTSEIQ